MVAWNGYWKSAIYWNVTYNYSTFHNVCTWFYYVCLIFVFILPSKYAKQEILLFVCVFGDWAAQRFQSKINPAWDRGLHVPFHPEPFYHRKSPLTQWSCFTTSLSLTYKIFVVRTFCYDASKYHVNLLLVQLLNIYSFWHVSCFWRNTKYEMILSFSALWCPIFGHD